MKNFFSLLLLFFIIISNAQSDFQNGYFIDSNGKKIDCLIDNKNWSYTPIRIKYKINKNSEILLKDTEDIREFLIYEKVKYIKSKVNIDMSSSKIDELSTSRISTFEQQELLLKVLLEGDIRLYQFSEVNLERYFYSKQDSIIPLEYKKYLTTSGNIGENLNYKIQLKNDLSCASLSAKKIKYNARSLINYFKDYINCKSLTINENYSNLNQKKGKINLFGKISYSLSSLTVKNNLDYRDIANFDAGHSYKIGFELEYLFSFNHKWSVFIEPTYQSFSNEKEVKVIFSPSSSTTYIGIIDYSSIEIPVGFKYYLYNNTKQNFFISAGFVIDFFSNGEFRKEVISNGNNLPSNTFASVKTEPTFFSGIGYTINNKFRVDIQYNFNRKILDSALTTDNLSNFSIKLGYNFL